MGRRSGKRPRWHMCPSHSGPSFGCYCPEHVLFELGKANGTWVPWSGRRQTLRFSWLLLSALVVQLCPLNWATGEWMERALVSRLDRSEVNSQPGPFLAAELGKVAEETTLGRRHEACVIALSRPQSM